MLTSFITLSLALSVLASPYKRDTILSISLSGPASNVTSINNLKFMATVANTGSELVKILKYRMILDDMLPTQSFTVTKDGETVNFTGIKISVSLKDTNDSAFVVIPPGQSVTAKHDVSALFDFASAGPGTFTFTPVTSFSITGPEVRVTNGVSLDHVSVSSNSVDVNISSLETCYTAAKALASAVTSYIAANSTDTLYTSYFGTTPTSMVTKIYFCNIFYYLDASPAVCLSSMDNTVTADGVTLHEFTHATSHTLDVSYSCANDRALPPAEQAVNADSYKVTQVSIALGSGINQIQEWISGNNVLAPTVI
ncbi:Metalloprotease [Desarmillaria tabescens]|uniref:deuterolysin n=1 Tax=Armillaria tabescens TaxID=1929756 RepID=A0AA39MLI9_ARMTA|nr:Metalloprotease [Desarmillaria tabescens]XP_060323036.1 Metalloprotease [Desarmillaria tabescens]KAK0438722.1 Metalloprotease [Desarmillaria tabescens]KAK0438727.1 Metalloprotease [Desarmillaria tabescens]